MALLHALPKRTVFLVLTLLSCILADALAQEPQDEADIRRVIRTLFEGMQAGDSAMVRSTFTTQPTFATVFRDKTGTPQLQRTPETFDLFLNAVGTPHDDAWNEEIWDVQVRIDGDFAHAWAQYAFYLGNTFSHCGVDSFHLYKSNGTWKIFHLADTRRTAPCNVPDDVRMRHH